MIVSASVDGVWQQCLLSPGLETVVDHQQVASVYEPVECVMLRTWLSEGDSRVSITTSQLPTHNLIMKMDSEDMYCTSCYSALFASSRYGQFD